MSAPSPIDWHGPRRQPCPTCDKGPRDKALAVDVEADGRGVAYCHRCGYVETHRPDHAAWQRAGRAVLRSVAASKRATLSDYGRDLFAACTGLAGTIGEAYLRARGCVLPPADGDLRFHPALRHPSGVYGAALVALVTHAETRAPMTLHRTWIRPDGRKADLEPPRLLLGGHAKKHGVIRLWPDDAVTYGLAVAEGIESALSLAHAFKPTWAAIDASNLGGFPVLPGIESLTIAADNDTAGTAAAKACATRWAAAGREVFMVLPPQGDLNDIAQGAEHDC